MRTFSARSFWLPVMLTTLLAAFFGSVLARRGRHLERMLARQARLQGQIAQRTEENRQVRAERDALLSSPEAVERVAREEYGFAGPGEKVTEYQPRGARAKAARPATVRLSRWQRLLMWRHLTVALPAAVFLATAVVFGMWNASRASKDGPATETSRHYSSGQQQR
jgi:cell division protein FtsB